MKLNNNQIEKLARRILNHLKTIKSVKIESTDEQIQKKIKQILFTEIQKEIDLDQEVNNMLDKLEKSNPGEFQRFKMFGLLKKRLAKEKGIIL